MEPSMGQTFLLLKFQDSQWKGDWALSLPLEKQTIKQQVI